MFCNNPTYFPDDSSKVNWSLTHLDTGPRDAIEKHFAARQSCAIMWEAFCSLLLDYVRPPETRQQAARIAFVKYKQLDDQSVRDYTEHSAHLAAQLPNDFSQAERAITYLGGLKWAVRKYLPVHDILRTFSKAAEMARLIESNVELLSVDPASGYEPVWRPQGDRARSVSPRKREGSPSQGDRERDGHADRQQSRGHRSKRKDRSRVRLEERMQPAGPPATPTQPTAPSTPTPPQRPTGHLGGSPYPPLPRKADGTTDWEKVLCHGCGKHGHTKRMCAGGGLGRGPGAGGAGPSGSQPTSVSATVRSEKSSA